jgi:leucyl-tRNA synthetase
MVSGEFAGLSVQDAKPKCKAALCASGQAFTYLEPEGLVTPRSTPDVECVVALVDQWYLKYGAHEWQAAVGKHLESLECFNPQVAKAFRDALAWLSDWACSRSFGLGTRIPWDEQVGLVHCLVIASDCLLWTARASRGTRRWVPLMAC